MLSSCVMMESWHLDGGCGKRLETQGCCLVMKGNKANAPCLVPLPRFPQDEAWSNKKGMDQAVANRVVLLPRDTNTSAHGGYNSFTMHFRRLHYPLPTAFASRSSEPPVVRTDYRATSDVFKPLPEPPTATPYSHRTNSA